ncbi:hypothetical protein [Microlunatus flavus]|uniref:Uncharacterized protein n=1 Tax=Microlunatus flavus TaxID=1036181 RepID=A0A1H9B676_9ACTN|nr:hypothetical protein [Microlunatus flavus]SEP84211.1 hypothetical protein SAMN05421756_101851 [Microlunatus flavus]
MSAPDPDAWWSPVPGPPPAAQPAPDAYGATPPWSARPLPGPDPAEPTPRRPRQSRTWWVAGVGALVLAVAAGLVVVLVVRGTKVLYDSARTVSVQVPRSWYDNTGEPGSDPGSPPVIAASNLWQSRRVEVDRFDTEDGDTLESFHAEGVDRECAGWPCSSRSGSRRLVVAGHPALEQVVTHPADGDGGASSSLTLTVWLDDRAVEVYGLATSSGDDPPDAAPLERVATSLQLL